jgi:hypothetical protein
MNLELNMTQAAQAAGMPLPTLAGVLRRGVIRGLDASAGNPGKAGRHFNFKEVLSIALYGALAHQMPGSRLLGERAVSCAEKAYEVVIGYLYGVRDHLGFIVSVTYPSEQEDYVYIGSQDDVIEAHKIALERNAAFHSIPLEPIVERILHAQGHVDLDAIKGKLKNEHVKIGKEGRQSIFPPVEGHGGVIVQPVRHDSSSTGLNVTREGIRLYYRGFGLRAPLNYEQWKHLASQIAIVMEEIEQSPAQSKLKVTSKPGG